MCMTKYQKYFRLMLEENTQAFKDFEEIHALYSLEPEKYQDELNQQGSQILDIIRDYENKLCSHSEKGKYSQFSANLSEKFQALVKSKFPKIDFVGITIKKPENHFNIRKISFS